MGTKTKHFEQARHDALHEIEFINYELGRMGREDGRKPARKAALQQIIQIIDLYNQEEWELIASIDTKKICNKMYYDNTRKIESIEDVKSFAFLLKTVHKLNFHPDEDFEDYVDYKTNQPSFTPEQCKTYNEAMEKCFDVCETNGVDIYELMGEVLNS